MVEPFPKLKMRGKEKDAPDFSPGIKLFGRRFPADQTASDLLLEFLLVATSPKRFLGKDISDGDLLPDLDLLRSASRADSIPDGSNAISYAPKARLNLKLLAFLGSSKLDTRHETHRQQYRKLLSRLIEPNMLSTSGALERQDVFRTIENLFVGFQGVGANRTWCAQSFLPISRGLIAGESIWQETKARRDRVASWADALTCFSHNQQIFLARGGELLYLQLCNALRQDASIVRAWIDRVAIGALNAVESEPSRLYSEVTTGLEAVLLACPTTIGELAEYLDNSLGSETSQVTDLDSQKQPRFSVCGWCPEECWPEAYLFAVEISRLCRAMIDPIERLELLETACAMQELRSLCAQAVRYTSRPQEATAAAGPLGYVWAISDPVGKETAIKQISRRNVNAVQRLIYDALRDPRIRNSYDCDPDVLDSAYAEADRRYGHKLFLTVAKRLGLITPRRGAGARFVLNDRLLRYLVLSTIRPGERVTYDSFKKLLFVHHGLAVDDHAIGQSCLWSGTSRLTTLGGNADEWLLQMLDASGVLIRLSDACSLVKNPFGGDPSA